jgi:hypothetical protein
MIKRTLLLGFLSTLVTLARDPSQATGVSNTVAPPKFEGQNRVVSSSKQFRVSGGESADRSRVALLAEEAKDDLLRLTEDKDEWKVPITVTLHGKSGSPSPPRTVALQIYASEAGYDLRLDYHLSGGLVRETLLQAATSALIYEQTLRGRPTTESETPFLVPPWLVTGLREATAWRLNQGDRRLYEALFKSGGLFKIDELFSLNQAGYDDMDAATRAAFCASSGALVMALLQQPHGVEGFRSFLREVAAFEGEMPALLRKHFPELNLSENSLAKWWALQLANIGGQNLTTDVLSIVQTETALGEALKINFRMAEGIIEPKDLSAWPELAKRPEPERVQAVQIAQQALVRLSYRCFPSYRPILEEYQLVLNALVKGGAKDLPNRIKALDERRASMRQMAQRGRDYLDWFEITRARQTSGAFDDYIRLKDRLKESRPSREDAMSKYLDRMDAIFSR